MHGSEHLVVNIPNRGASVRAFDMKFAEDNYDIIDGHPDAAAAIALGHAAKARVDLIARMRTSMPDIEFSFDPSPCPLPQGEGGLLIVDRSNCEEKS